MRYMTYSSISWTLRRKWLSPSSMIIQQQACQSALMKCCFWLFVNSTPKQAKTKYFAMAKRHETCLPFPCRQVDWWKIPNLLGTFDLFERSKIDKNVLKAINEWMDSVMMNGATPCEVLQILEQKQQLSELQPVITEDDDDPAFCTALLRGAKINELFRRWSYPRLLFRVWLVFLNTQLTYLYILMGLESWVGRVSCFMRHAD